MVKQIKIKNERNIITTILKGTKAMFFKLNTTARILTSFLLVLTIPHQAAAAGPAPVDLRSTADFVILSGAAITTTGGGIVTGNVGASPITGAAIHLTCAQVNGTIYTVDPAGPLPCRVIDSTLLTTAKGDLTIAYNDAAGRTFPDVVYAAPGEIGLLNLAPGLYKFTSTAQITTGDLTLTGGANDVWIFQIATALTVGSGIHVVLAGGAQAKNIFWQVGTSAVLDTFSDFKGTIMADQAITMKTSSTIEGRALAFEAGVTFNGNGMALPAAPEIAVEQPLGVNLVDGVSTNDFGSVVTNTSTSLTFTIKNTGDADLTILGFSIDGTDSTMFSLTAIPSVPVSPGGSTTFTVQFAPSSPGLKTAALHIGNNDSDENPFDITITGTGTGIGGAPEIAVEQPPGTDLVDGVSTNDFGSVAVGASTSLIFTITNSGTANLTISGITIDGANAASFIVTNLIATVSPGGSTTFTVQFAPGSPGLKTAALHIANNDSDENPFDITITGTGTTVPAPEIAVEQPPGTDLVDGVSSKDFGSVAVGASTSLIFTITNSGNADLTILGFSIDGTDSTMFSLTVIPSASVSPGGSTTFTVQFAPGSPGLKTAALHIANNDSDENPFDITITGTGTGGGGGASTNDFAIAVSPITLNRQTGLFEQTVHLTNSSTNTFVAVRLLIRDLPDDVQVYNASGFTNDIPFVQYNLPLATNASVDLLIEYYRANRDPNFQPTFEVQATTALSVTATGTVIKINLQRPPMQEGRFFIEFSATLGRRYAVQYSSDMTNWKTADPIITAPANRVQWYDDGPPKTESKPTTIGSRFYRIMELP
jgi:copper(I)-binding protein